MSKQTIVTIATNAYSGLFLICEVSYEIDVSWVNLNSPRLVDITVKE